jgi:hypothetical protein
MVTKSRQSPTLKYLRNCNIKRIGNEEKRGGGVKFVGTKQHSEEN